VSEPEKPLTPRPPLPPRGEGEADLLLPPPPFVGEGGRGGEGTPLLVFADDWGRHPSSCQHLVRRLLPRYSVHWVNTIGTRTPRLDLATLKRGLEKLRHWSRSEQQTAAVPNLHVHSPRMWPWFTSAFDRWLNRGLLLRQLRRLVSSLPEPPVAVTTLPLTADLLGALPVRRWVYYCVDDFSQWPGLDHEPLRRMEEPLVKKADVLIAVSEHLQDKLARMGRTAHLLTHGVDLECWRSPPDGPVPELDGLERPLVVFWGVIDRRMDMTWVRCLAGALTRGTIVLVGPQAEPDEGWLEVPRVHRVGPLPFERLPAVGREAAVLIMPYRDAPVTQAMQPLKLKEYLATGKPVVVRDLLANRAWADCLDLADEAWKFAEAVCRRLETGLPEEQRRARARLAEESWEHKARQFEAWAIPGVTTVSPSPRPAARGGCCQR
jgi:glycosyltransferase involved in cell wall biosynthesis